MIENVVLVFKPRDINIIMVNDKSEDIFDYIYQVQSKHWKLAMSTSKESVKHIWLANSI